MIERQNWFDSKVVDAHYNLRIFLRLVQWFMKYKRCSTKYAVQISNNSKKAKTNSTLNDFLSSYKTGNSSAFIPAMINCPSGNIFKVSHNRRLACIDFSEQVGMSNFRVHLNKTGKVPC